MSKKDIIEIEVPTSWEDVTINKYQRLQQIIGQEFKSDLKRTEAITKCLCDIDDITTLPLESFYLISENIKFINDKVTQERFKEVEIDGDVYRWVGSFNELTVGELISIEQIIDIEQLTFNMAYDVVAAILLRKVNKQGGVEDFNSDLFTDRRELFSKLPITKINGMLLFFLIGGKLSTRITQVYSVKLSKTQTSTQKRSRLLRTLSGLKSLLTPRLNG